MNVSQLASAQFHPSCKTARSTLHCPFSSKSLRKQGTEIEYLGAILQASNFLHMTRGPHRFHHSWHLRTWSCPSFGEHNHCHAWVAERLLSTISRHLNCALYGSEITSRLVQFISGNICYKCTFTYNSTTEEHPCSEYRSKKFDGNLNWLWTPINAILFMTCILLSFTMTCLLLFQYAMTSFEQSLT